MHKQLVKFSPALVSLVSLISTSLLVGCGGWWDGDDPAASGAGTAGGTLTVSVATPAANNTTLNLASAKASSNTTRAADAFSAAAYCAVSFEGFSGANGVTYTLQVYFRQSDKAPLNASLVGGSPPSYVVFSNNSGNAITGLTVDSTARSITFTNKVLSDTSGQAGTVSGTVTFPANTATPACGA